MSRDRRWIVRDRDNNYIYLTEERWQHIVDPDNHLEMVDYEEHLKTAIQRGYRRQEPLNPRKYRYVYPFDDLPDGSNHVVAIVLFGFDVDEAGNTTQNNYITTAFFKHIRLKGGHE
ncbi:MAG: hypothetical protein NT075_28175 [Chloroflexi bacterium]|nr:hypothetical protein [Chloroflexota bacterium]